LLLRSIRGVTSARTRSQPKLRWSMRWCCSLSSSERGARSWRCLMVAPLTLYNQGSITFSKIKKETKEKYEDKEVFG